MGCRPNLWAIKGAPCPPVVSSCSALIIPIPSLLLSHSTLFVNLAPSRLVVPPFHFLSQPSAGSPLLRLSVPNCSKAHLNSLGSAASSALPADVTSPPRLPRLLFTLALISVLSLFPFTNPTLPACRSSRVPNSPSSPF